MRPSNPDAPALTALRAGDAADIAATLVEAWHQAACVTAPTELVPALSRADALAIADRVRALRIADGAVAVGYKVGFTNGAVREQFAADGPMAATVYDDTLQSRPRVVAGALLGPRIEPEVVVGIGSDGEAAWAALGFEIVQSHVADWNFRYLDAIADFGLHARLIIGQRRAIGGADAPWLAAMSVILSRDGEFVERGAGSDVDGGAFGSVRWLRDDLARAGRELLPGEIVSTGSMTRVPPILAGQRWTIETTGGELPALSIDVE